MEDRNRQSILRVGPSSAGESHTAPQGAVRPVYTEGPTATRKDEGAEMARRNDGGATTREGPSPVLLTALGTDKTTTMETDDLRMLSRTPTVLLERLEDSESRPRVATPVPAKSRFFRTEEGSSGEYESGMETTSSLTREDEEMERNRRRFRKRRGSKSPEEERAEKASTSKRGRGRPPTTGHYVGLAKAKRDLADEEWRALEVEAERDILETAKRIPQLRSHRLSESSTSDGTLTGTEEITSATLGAAVTSSLGAITEVAQKSKHLKGQSVAALKKATHTLQEAYATLLNRTTSAETKALEAENARLSRELQEMKTELETIKRRLVGAQPPSAPTNLPSELSVEELLQRAVREAVSLTSARMDARLESLEARLLPEPRLRPPLAADRKKDSSASARTAAGPSKQIGKERVQPEPSVSTLMPPTNSAPALRGAKGTRKKISAAAVEAAASRRDAAPTPAASQPALSRSWAQVARNGKATSKNVEEKGPQRTRRRNRRRRNRLRAPKSAAVVLTLQPEAEKRGVSYKEILARAKQSVDLAALEIPAVRYKLAVTGARMYEISGAACKEKADALAGKLRETFGEEDVRITRPQKCAELRVTGLDDAATAEEIAAAVARPGGCNPDDVRSPSQR